MKPDLFLIHGWNTPPAVWESLTHCLADDFSITLGVLPGYRCHPGDSRDESNSNSSASHPGTVANRDPWVDEQLAALISQAPSGAHWISWSLGATLAMLAAIEKRARIASLTLISPSPRFLAADDWQPGSQRSRFDRLLKMTHRDYRAGLKLFLSWQTAGGAVDNLPQVLEQWTALRPTPAALDAGHRVLCDTDLRQRLSEIEIETLVIAATQDQVIPPSASEYVANQIPGARWRQIGNNHAIPWTCGRPLASAIRSFIGAATT